MAQRVVITAHSADPRALIFTAADGEPAGPDFGRWTGLGLDEVGAAEPEALGAWLRDPYANPHGGESLAAMIGRVGRWLDEQPWPDGRSEIEVLPLVARGLIVHALGAPPEVIFRVDVGPGGRTLLSRSGSFWRLVELSRG